MKYSICILLLILSNCSSSQEVTNNINIFKPLDDEVLIHSWGVNNQTKAKIFETIYFGNTNNASFEDILFKYLNEDDKYYWIGTYLDDNYYTKINNYQLSVKTLKAGLNFVKNNEKKIRYYWTIGRKLYFNNSKKESLNFLIPAYNLSKIYPGNMPAWDNENEDIEINSFIKNNLK